MRFAIFVRKGHETYNKVDEVPEQLRQRTLAVRAFDGNGMMLSFALAEGQELAGVIDKLFRQSSAAYLHVHFAAAGCYAAKVERA
jgi:transcriptional regulator